MSATRELAEELTRCLVTPGQLACLEWLVRESERNGDPMVRAMATEVLAGWVRWLFVSAPRQAVPDG